MKAKLLLLLLLAISSFCFGTHYRAGYITTRYVGGTTFEVSLIAFTKTGYPSNLADKNYAVIDFGDGSSDTVFRVNGPDTDSDGFPDGEDCFPDVRKSIYSGLHTYAGVPPQPNNFFVIAFIDMNRIDGISNIDNGNSVNVPLYLNDTLYIEAITAAPQNSSPEILYCGTDYGNVGDSYNFSPPFYDADGDSLAFVSTTPMQALGLPVPAYQFPDEYCLAHWAPNNTYAVDNLTGRVTWSSPCQVGIYNVAMLVKEYRCGVLLSSSIFDFQMIDSNEPNDPPSFGTSTGNFMLQPGDTLSVHFTATDTSAQTVALTAYAGPLNFAQNPATFAATTGNPASADLMWVPDATQARQNAYIFSIRASDNYTIAGPNGATPVYLFNWQTFKVWVTDSAACTFTAVPQLSADNFAFQLSPNPAGNEVYITSPEAIKELNIFSVDGRLVLTKNNLPVSTSIPLATFAPGIYIVRVRTLNHYGTQRLIKQ